MNIPTKNPPRIMLYVFSLRIKANRMDYKAVYSWSSRRSKKSSLMRVKPPIWRPKSVAGRPRIMYIMWGLMCALCDFVLCLFDMRGTKMCLEPIFFFLI